MVGWILRQIFTIRWVGGPISLRAPGAFRGVPCKGVAHDIDENHARYEIAAGSLFLMMYVSSWSDETFFSFTA